MSATVREILDEPKTPTVARKRSDFFYYGLRNKKLVFGLGLELLLVVFAIVGPMIAKYGPQDLTGAQISHPNGTFWLGTDTLGRDIFSQMANGIRESYLVGALAAGYARRGTRRELRLAALAIPAAAVVLCLLTNNHGIGLAVGCLLGVPLASRLSAADPANAIDPADAAHPATEAHHAIPAHPATPARPASAAPSASAADPASTARLGSPADDGPHRADRHFGFDR